MKKARATLTIFTICILFIGTLALSAQDDEPETPEGDNVSVTVYNQGSALVQDRRTFTFETGINTLDFTDVAAQIDATSVSFTSLTDPQGTIVLEQNYVYDLVNADALLQRYLDQVIEVTTNDGNGENVFVGTLLSGRGGEIILRTEDGEVVVVRSGNARDIRFPELPDGLITRPTLRWLINSVNGGEQQVELTYLTNGMGWTADYILLLESDNTALDLNGWVTLTNTSGTAYEDAQLKLVAGDLNRVQDRPDYLYDYEMAPLSGAVADEARVSQREFFEYQLYEVNRRVTIGNNETKQVEFVTGNGVAANTYFVYNGGVPFYGYGSPIIDQYYGGAGVTDVQNYLEFSTGEENGLGADLPAGRVRVYQEDADGAALLIGENFIDHTPQGEEIDLYLGNAFDLVGERTQTMFEFPRRGEITETYEIRLRNRKDDETVEIRVPETLFRWSNWEILDNSHDFTQLNSNTIEFRVDVPPGEETIITYTVRYTWPVNN